MCTQTHLQPGRHSKMCGARLEDELQLVLVALEHALEGLGGHEQQHARETIVQNDGHVVDVHAADDQHRVFRIAAVDRLVTKHRSNHTCTNSGLRGRTRSAARASGRSDRSRCRHISPATTFYFEDYWGILDLVDVHAAANEHWVAVADVDHLENRRSNELRTANVWCATISVCPFLQYAWRIQC